MRREVPNDGTVPRDGVEARTGATRWVEDNMAVYQHTGRLLEKYNVESSGLAGGGEYEVQDGFGWTNAVLLRLIGKLSL